MTASAAAPQPSSFSKRTSLKPYLFMSYSLQIFITRRSKKKKRVKTCRNKARGAYKKARHPAFRSPAPKVYFVDGDGDVQSLKHSLFLCLCSVALPADSFSSASESVADQRCAAPTVSPSSPDRAAPKAGHDSARGSTGGRWWAKRKGTGQRGHFKKPPTHAVQTASPHNGANPPARPAHWSIAAHGNAEPTIRTVRHRESPPPPPRCTCPTKPRGETCERTIGPDTPSECFRQLPRRGYSRKHSRFIQPSHTICTSSPIVPRASKTPVS